MQTQTITITLEISDQKPKKGRSVGFRKVATSPPSKLQHHFLSEDGSLITSDIEGIRKHLKLTKGVEQKLMAGEVVKGWRIVLLRDCYKSLYPSPVVP